MEMEGERRREAQAVPAVPVPRFQLACGCRGEAIAGARPGRQGEDGTAGSGTAGSGTARSGPCRTVPCRAVPVEGGRGAAGSCPGHRRAAARRDVRGTGTRGYRRGGSRTAGVGGVVVVLQEKRSLGPGGRAERCGGTPR